MTLEDNKKRKALYLASRFSYYLPRFTFTHHVSENKIFIPVHYFPIHTDFRVFPQVADHIPVNDALI